MNADDLRIREVVDPGDPAIAGFGRMQRAAYFAPETLIPAQYIPQMLGGDATTGARRNFLVVAEMVEQLGFGDAAPERPPHGSDAESFPSGNLFRVVGGTLFHWLAEAGSGFSSFMGVDRALRGQGIARRLHHARFEALDRAAASEVRGVFIDVVNPARMPPSELERERAVGSDPWDRRRAFAHLGFRQVDIRYEQPVGGPDGGPVTVLDLLYCPRHSQDAEAVPTRLVVATMRAYWSPWLGERAAGRHARELESRAPGADDLALISPVPGEY